MIHSSTPSATFVGCPLGGTIPIRTSLTFTITADPPSAGRTVRIEQSSDKVRWVPVGPSARTKANGTAVVKVPGPAVGSWSYRATVAQDDKFAAAVSPVVGATVEDIKAAAAKYIGIVNQSNAALAAYKKATPATYATTVPANRLDPEHHRQRREVAHQPSVGG